MDIAQFRSDKMGAGQLASACTSKVLGGSHVLTYENQWVSRRSDVIRRRPRPDQLSCCNLVNACSERFYVLDGAPGDTVSDMHIGFCCSSRTLCQLVSRRPLLFCACTWRGHSWLFTVEGCPFHCFSGVLAAAGAAAPSRFTAAAGA